MNKREQTKLLKRRQTLKNKLKQIGPVMRGTIVMLGTKCGNPKCKCARGEKHLQYYFSITINRKTKLIFLGKAKLPIATEYVANYKKLIDITEEMTTINMEMIKAGIMA